MVFIPNLDWILYSVFSNDICLAMSEFSTAKRLEKRNVTHAGPAEGRKRYLGTTFWVFYPIKLKLCTLIELFIPKNRMISVF